MSILFADRISSLPIMMPAGVNNPSAKDGFVLEAGKESFAQAAQQFPCFEISNIADYVARERENNDKFHSLSELPPCSIPFMEFWMEYDVPEGYRQTAKKVGVFFEIHRHDLETQDGHLDMFSRLFRNAIDRGLPESDFREAQKDLNAELDVSAGDFAFSCRCGVATQIRTPNREGVMIQGTGHIAFDSRGRIIMPRIIGITNDQNSSSSEIMFVSLIPALTALAFMNCKNIKVQDNEPRRSLSKRHKNEFGYPLLSFKTLEIEPMKRVLETEGGIKQNGFKKALHICRGHFATYTPEKGMMGRKLEEPVTVWKRAHVRGDVEHGIAAKSYKVKTSKTP